VLERHYDYTSSAYHPERRSRDSSRAKPGQIDSYEMKAPARVPQPAPEPPRPGEAIKAEPSAAQDPEVNSTDSANSTIPAPLPPSNNTNNTDLQNPPVHDPSAFMSGEKMIPATSLSPAKPPPVPSPSFFEQHPLRIIIGLSLLGSCFLLLLLCCCCRNRKRRDSSRPIVSDSS